MTGRVVSVNVSAGGVPKLPVSQAWLAPGQSRVYARVLREGIVRAGDAVAVTLPP